MNSKRIVNKLLKSPLTVLNMTPKQCIFLVLRAFLLYFAVATGLFVFGLLALAPAFSIVALGKAIHLIAPQTIVPVIYLPPLARHALPVAVFALAASMIWIVATFFLVLLRPFLQILSDVIDDFHNGYKSNFGDPKK